VLSLTQRRIRDSKFELASAALEIVEREGWDAAGVAEIARSVGVSERTFYRYFPNKRDVFRPLLAEAGERSRARFAESREGEFPWRCADALVIGVETFPGGLPGAHRAYGVLLSTPELTPIWLDEALSFEAKLAPFLPGHLVNTTDPPPSGERIDDVRLLSALVFASMRVALQTWAEGSEPAMLHDLTIQAVSRTLHWK
jgi:AcrR family transcriptional regulator